MSRHSKNCTAHSILTSHEKAKILASKQEFGTITARLGTDSQKKFHECCLCLGRVRTPSAQICPQGHLFCLECITENLVQQSKRIAREKELAGVEQRKRDLNLAKDK